MFVGATLRHGCFLIACLATVCGCDKLRSLAPQLSTTAINGAAPASARRSNVIPTRRPPRRHIIEVKDERSLTGIARELGVTVEEIIATNSLTSTTIKPGQQLHVDASPADVVRFLSKREARLARKAARAKKKAAEKAAQKQPRTTQRKRIKRRSSSRRKKTVRNSKSQRRSARGRRPTARLRPASTR